MQFCHKRQYEIAKSWEEEGRNVEEVVAGLSRVRLKTGQADRVGEEDPKGTGQSRTAGRLRRYSRGKRSQGLSLSFPPIRSCGLARCSELLSHLDHQFGGDIHSLAESENISLLGSNDCC